MKDEDCYSLFSFFCDSSLDKGFKQDIILKGKALKVNLIFLP